MKKWIFLVVIGGGVIAGYFCASIFRTRQIRESEEISRSFKMVKKGDESESLNALRKAGSAALPILLNALESSDPSARAKAAWILGRLGYAARGAIPSLINALHDPFPNVRCSAAHSLAIIDSSRHDVIKQLLMAIQNTDIAMSISASDALDSMEKANKEKNLPYPSDDFDYVLAFVKSPAPDVRISGLLKMLRLPIRDRRAGEVLKELLNDANPRVREKALLLLQDTQHLEVNKKGKVDKSVSPIFQRVNISDVQL